MCCTSATNCFAVGYYSTGTYYPGSYQQTLIEQWNGTSWSIVPSPNISATQDNSLYGTVRTCILATNCFAVGFNSDDRTGIAQTLIQQWDGETWSLIVPSPNINLNGPPTSNRLFSVTCTSATNCFAVGCSTPTVLPIRR